MQTFDRYEIISQLGQGGMSDVFLATDPRFERQIALKILPAALLHEPGFRARFDQEAKLVAKLEHPAIIPVYDYGEFNGQPFLAMRYMKGGTLADQAGRAPLKLDEVDRIVQRLCRALDKAHSKNIIHRDIKPQNILFDEDGQAYLGDFGIARLAEGTQTMTIVGTPNYMAPEQAHGRDLDRRTDIYQVGVVLFEMLTGKQPFDAPTPVALLHQHAYAPIPSIRELNAGLPPACQTVVERALAKEKNDRYQTAGDLANDFSAACQGRPIMAVDPRAETILEEDLLHDDQRSVSPLLVGGGIAAGLVVLALLFFLYQVMAGPEQVSPTPFAEVQPATSTIDPLIGNNSGGETVDANAVAAAVAISLAETAVAETIAAQQVSAELTDVEPTPTPLITNTPVPSPTETSIPPPTKTPRPSPTPTPEVKGVGDFPFGPGIIVAGSYPSLDSAVDATDRYRSAGYRPAVFYRKANDTRANDEFRVALTGYRSESEAENALPGAKTLNNQAYTRDLTFWCPVYRDIEDGYECE